MKASNLHLIPNASRPGQSRHRRGAALVETVVVIPVFIALLASMLFIHHVVAKKQKAQLTARNTAWSKAMLSCQGGTEITQPAFASHMDGAPGAQATLTASNGQAVGNAVDTVSVSVVGTRAAAAADGGGISYFATVRANAVVMCNCTTRPGDIPGVFDWFTGAQDWKLIFGGPSGGTKCGLVMQLTRTGRPEAVSGRRAGLD